jgi:hypothetical protein
MGLNFTSTLFNSCQLGNVVFDNCLWLRFGKALFALLLFGDAVQCCVMNLDVSRYQEQIFE